MLVGKLDTASLVYALSMLGMLLACYALQKKNDVIICNIMPAVSKIKEPNVPVQHILCLEVRIGERLLHFSAWPQRFLAESTRMCYVVSHSASMGL